MFGSHDQMISSKIFILVFWRVKWDTSGDKIHLSSLSFFFFWFIFPVPAYSFSFKLKHPFLPFLVIPAYYARLSPEDRLYYVLHHAQLFLTAMNLRPRTFPARNRAAIVIHLWCVGRKKNKKKTVESTENWVICAF